MVDQAQAPDAKDAGTVPQMVFPKSLRKHFYDSADWPAVIFMGMSFIINVLFVGIIASRDWPDPTAALSKDELRSLQEQITRQFTVEVEQEQQDQTFDLSDVLNPEFEERFAEESARLESELASSIAEAEQVLRDVESMTEGITSGDIGGEMSDVQAELGDILGSLGDIGDIGADVGAGPALEIAPTDVAIFAEVAGATGSRVVSQAIDIGALGSNVQISSRFTSGGVSASEAARLSQQIQLARARLGGNLQLRVGSGGVGEGRRALLRVAGGGGRTGRRIQVEQLALPPQRATSQGGRDIAAVEREAAKTRNLIGGCYMIGLAEDPTLSGVVVVRFTINADGSVANVRVSQSNLGNPAVEECVIAAVQTWHFTAGGSAETFEHPFTFEPG